MDLRWPERESDGGEETREGTGGSWPSVGPQSFYRSNSSHWLVAWCVAILLAPGGYPVRDRHVAVCCGFRTARDGTYDLDRPSDGSRSSVGSRSDGEWWSNKRGHRLGIWDHDWGRRAHRRRGTCGVGMGSQDARAHVSGGSWCLECASLSCLGVHWEVSPLSRSFLFGA